LGEAILQSEEFSLATIKMAEIGANLNNGYRPENILNNTLTPEVLQ
jgi:hypothetical protein